MCNGRIISLVRGSIGAALLLLVPFAGESSVHASCGDYLMVGGQPHPAATTAPAEEPSEPCPCRGPECNGAPQTPLPTAPDRTFSTNHDRWCTALSGHVPLLPSATRIDHEQTQLVPDGFPATIDRPPRA